ncbi:transglycosylase SLT domain-containing protein [Legionella pneumophila serogroup 1]|uniref:Transglycosylase SLT domain-containing protein n=2 Tax=Legionella pneumophila TaxID=446 RepID=A0AAN5Q4E0_LEGPN|nr:transglycosylase SLT domain-containing protein [Legionella pneumophila]ABQ54563.1 membrane bound lytic murein transglycosylase D [Legionella pneumophila str. Corby]ADG24497.1 membrane bound lytic murein transglycosylase [Legionella pneumophila 2300/99 Alcoy]MCK1859591.1 transglycosylase SLT domain-containing protein [Legionella pneumophila]MCO1451208.1 transglycosylase SLT domain-containing protein [Legionella pneumophila]MCW8402059.1 transglycosylase SLT domain-containing protein [Legionel
MIKTFIDKKMQLLFSCLIFFIFSTHAKSFETPDVWDVLRSEFKMNHEAYRPEVQDQIRWLLDHPGFVTKACKQAEPYLYHVTREIQRRNLPGELALLPMIESAYDPFAYSKVGAAGLWQIMPVTGNQLGLIQDWWFDGRRSINHSTDAALTHLMHLNKVFNGNWILSIAAYDAGEGAIGRAVKANNTNGGSVSFWNLDVPKETQIYVPRFLALAEIMSNPRAYKINLPAMPFRPYFEEVNIGSQIDLNHAASLAGISVSELTKLNPGYNRWATAPYKPFTLLIPIAKVTQFYFNLSHSPVDKRVSWRKHLVLPSDSLQSIARKYHTTVSLIKKLNRLSDHSIRPNQILLIPSAKSTPSLPFHEISKSKFLSQTPTKGKVYRVIHIVQANETYNTLERLYKVTAQDIMKWNHIGSGEALVKGRQLIIWKKSSNLEWNRTFKKP